MSESLPPPSLPLSTRVFAALALAVPAALVAVVPAALRISATGDVSLVRAWLFLAGFVAIPMGLLGLVARRAYRGWCAIGKDEAGLRLAIATGWLAWTGLFSDRLGAILRAKTHHHALAGVTFALAIAVVAAILALVAWRSYALLRALERRNETLARLLAVAWVVAPVVGLVFALRAAAPELDAGARACVVDGTALLLGAVVASRTLHEPRRALAIGGVVAFFGLLAVGILGSRDPSVIAAVEASAPLLARVVPH